MQFTNCLIGTLRVKTCYSDVSTYVSSPLNVAFEFTYYFVHPFVSSIQYWPSLIGLKTKSIYNNMKHSSLSITNFTNHAGTSQYSKTLLILLDVPHVSYTLRRAQNRQAQFPGPASQLVLGFSGLEPTYHRSYLSHILAI